VKFTVANHTFDVVYQILIVSPLFAVIDVNHVLTPLCIILHVFTDTVTPVFTPAIVISFVSTAVDKL
jgi:hypothetical protein